MLDYLLSDVLHLLRQLESTHRQRFYMKLFTFESDRALIGIISQVMQRPDVRFPLEQTDFGRPDAADHLILLPFWIHEPLQHSIVRLLAVEEEVMKLFCSEELDDGLLGFGVGVEVLA